MQLAVFKSTWGMEGEIEAQLHAIAAAGYAGAEMLVPDDADGPRVRAALGASGLEAIPLVLHYSEDRDAYRREIERAVAMEPAQITSHTSGDWLSNAEAVDFLGWALELERETGVPIAHETHRGHLLATPWQTAAVLRELPDLRIAADYSHWVVVAERLLDDRAGDIELANRHAIHVHARVGSPEAPQVNDPRVPANRDLVERFEAWWAAIMRARIEAGADRLTITPEYGPPPYMPTLPATDEPVADLWEICLWGAGRVRDLHARVEAGRG